MRGRDRHSNPPELSGPSHQLLKQFDAQTAWHERRRARAAAARAKGRRFGTI